MISFDLHPDMRAFRHNTYSVSRSSKAYPFFNNEYRNIKGNDFDYLLVFPPKKKGIISTIIGNLSRTDTSIKVNAGSIGHLFFATEYNHMLQEDMDHNIIVPEEIHKERVR